MEKLAGYCRQRAEEPPEVSQTPVISPRPLCPSVPPPPRHTWPTLSLAHHCKLPWPSVALDMDPDLRTRHTAPPTHTLQLEEGDPGPGHFSGVAVLGSG